MKRLTAILLAAASIAALAPPVALARETSTSKPPTITVNAANGYAKKWAAVKFAKPQVQEFDVNGYKGVEEFAFKKLEPCRNAHQEKFEFFICPLETTNIIRASSIKTGESTSEKPFTGRGEVTVSVDRASKRSVYERNSRLVVYPLENMWRVYVFG